MIVNLGINLLILKYQLLKLYSKNENENENENEN